MNATTDESVPAGKPHDLARPRLRVWLPLVVLVVYWCAVEGIYRWELPMFTRFISRMIALLALLLFFLVWGLTRRHFRWRERLLAFGLIVGTMVVASLVGHPSTGMMATAMLGLPIVLTLVTPWLGLARNQPAGRELAGIGVISLLVFGVIVLLRWDGIDGRQRLEMSWRWTPTAEEQFLSSAAKATDSTPQAEPLLVQQGDDDWTSFRGGARESVVPGIVLGDWSAEPPKQVWRRRVGPAWSSVIVVGDYLFTQEQRSEREAVVCYRVSDGTQMWAHLAETADGRFEDALSGTGPRATPSYHDGRIYSYGAKGRLECLDAATGKAVWSRNLLEEVGGKVTQWGLSVSPLVVDELVVVFAGGTDGRALLGLDRSSGEAVWNCKGGTVTFSSPQLMTIGGVRQVVMQDESGLYAVGCEDGKKLWKHPSPHALSQPMLQPHLVGDDSLIVAWGNGILRLRITREGDDWSLAEEWTSNRLKPGFNDFLIHRGNLYGLDDGILCCIDGEQGRRLWKGGRYGFGQLLLLPAADELLVLTEQGEVVRVAARPDKHRELGRFKAIDGKTWNHPVISSGSLIVRNAEEMACFRLPDTRPTAGSETTGTETSNAQQEE